MSHLQYVLFRFVLIWVPRECHGVLNHDAESLCTQHSFLLCMCKSMKTLYKLQFTACCCDLNRDRHAMNRSGAHTTQIHKSTLCRLHTDCESVHTKFVVQAMRATVVFRKPNWHAIGRLLRFRPMAGHGLIHLGWSRAKRSGGVQGGSFVYVCVKARGGRTKTCRMFCRIFRT